MTQKHQRTTSNFVQLPLMGNVAIYSRVVHEKGTQDTQTKEIALTQFASQLGYGQEQVTIYTDEGAAAAAPLLERQGYTALLQAIRSGGVCVLFVSDVSRFLAEATQLEINTFIHSCMMHGVFVVTPHTVFDFTDLAHVALFRQQCTQACTMLHQTSSHQKTKY